MKTTTVTLNKDEWRVANALVLSAIQKPGAIDKSEVFSLYDLRKKLLDAETPFIVDRITISLTKCDLCDGRGSVAVRNGPDDIDFEECPKCNQ